MEQTFTKQYKVIGIKSTSDEVVIRPFGDIHADATAHDYDRWHDTLRYWKKTDTPKTFYLGMGDYLDFMATGERCTIDSNKKSIHKETLKAFDKSHYKQLKDFAKDIEFMRGRILGFIEGNHSWTFYSDVVPNITGKSSTQVLSDMFETHNLGWITYFRIIFKYTERTWAYDIFACHGKAGGKLKGTSINQVDDLKRIFPVADLYLMAHNHDKFAVPTSVLVAIKDENEGFKIKQKEQYLGRTGSFLKSYVPNDEGYLVGMLKTPASLGVIEFNLNISSFAQELEKFEGKRRRYRQFKIITKAIV